MAHQQLTNLTPAQIAALAYPQRTPSQRVIYVADREWSALLSAQGDADPGGGTSVALDGLSRGVRQLVPHPSDRFGLSSADPAYGVSAPDAENSYLDRATGDHS